MKNRYNLIGLAALLIAVCSCTSPVQELSSFWDGHDFRSLKEFDNIKAAEDKFDRYIDLLNKVSYEDAVENMNHFLDSAALDTVAYMVWSGWFEPFLHAQQSPYRNDRLFTAWLDRVLEDQIIDDEGMMNHLAYMRKVIEKNTVGSTLEDICVCNESGEEFMLSELLGQKTLILMVDANCPSCLSSLEENAEKPRNSGKVALLVGGTHLHLANIRRQLPESVLENWTLVCVSRKELEGRLYDLYNLPARLIVSENGKIVKSYH